MTKSQVAKNVEAVNGNGVKMKLDQVKSEDTAVVLEELSQVLMDFTEKHPSCAIGVAITNKGLDGKIEGEQAISGMVGFHQLLHSIDALMKMVMGEGMKQDPEAVQSFLAELAIKSKIMDKVMDVVNGKSPLLPFMNEEDEKETTH